ncbi:MAG: glycosyltransferase family 39 protein [Candidatus Eremiobacteraeota bacterium]|nr:glycosyltransferase family 39 protein [Candidatus Eremiobacteraeota bacterium]
MVLCALRIAAAIRFPVAGDEAYYWEWSRRLAFGYIDHPPMVAWLIAAFTFASHNALLLRAGFLVCGLIASVAAWDFVRVATGSSRRALLAALAVNLTPLGLIAFNFASPDGPFLAMWIVSLACTLRALRDGQLRWWIFAGMALGFAGLSRVFAIALVPGILWIALAGSDMRRRNWFGVTAASIVALIVVAPYFAWNALHGWAGVEFAVMARHHFTGISLRRFVETIVGALAVGGLFFVPLMVRALFIDAGERTIGPRLLASSAAPLGILLVVLSLFEPVEVYWFAGPMLSMLVLPFSVRMHWSVLRRWLLAAFMPSAVVAIGAFLLACAPLSLIVRIASALPPGVSTASALEIYSDSTLAATLAARYPQSTIFTDEYGLSSLLDFYGGIPPYVIGYNSQGREALRWLAAPSPTQTIYLDHIEISRRPDMVRLLDLACGSVERMPGVVVREGGRTIHSFSLSRCRKFDGHSLAILNQTLWR